MPGCTPRPTAGLLFELLVLWCCTAAGQGGTAPAAEAGKQAPPQPNGVAGQVKELKPPLYLLKDKDGNLQAVPGFTLEDFHELYELKHLLQQPDRTPDYSLQTMTVTGRVAGGHAELAIEFRILVRDEQCRVPLRLDQAVLRKEVEYAGPGKQFLHFEEDGQGYVSWIRGGAGKQHQLTLHVLVPLSTVGGQSRLRLRCPRATTSELKVKVPLPDVVATVSEPATLLPPSTVEGKATELTALGLGGDFELAWRKQGTRPAETSTALDAVGQAAARIDGRTVSTQMDLTVRAYGAEFDRFGVRLPKGAKLEPGSPSGYTVAQLDERLLEVRFAAKSSEQHARLVFSQAHDVDKPDQWFELAGFEVLGAARHRGHIAVAVTGDWHVLWEPPRAVRQTEELPEGLKIDALVAGFEYFSQPCSLRARLAPKKTRVTVEPEYRLLVGAKQVQLQATFDFLVRGAKVSGLKVEIPDWQVDEVTPDNLVIADAVKVSQSKLVSIPLKQQSLGHVKVNVLAHQEVPPEAKSLSLALPRRPQVDSPGEAAVLVLPAAVVVLPDDNVELIPNDKAMAGLTRQLVSPQMKLPARQQAPLFYRADAANPMFTSAFRVHQRAVTVNASAQIGVDEQSIAVEQRLAYAIAYEVLGTLSVSVPPELAGSDGLTFEVDGQTLAAVASSSPDDKPDPSAPVPMSITLPQPRIGPCELVVRYRLPTEKLQPEQSVLRTVPLVMPADGQLADNRLSVTAAAGIEVQCREGPWTVSEPCPGQPARRGVQQLSATGPAGQVLLAVHLEEAETAGSTVVERAWVQTWLSQSARQDRAVFRLLSSRKDLEVAIPAEAAIEQTEVLLDGRSVPVQTAGDGHLVVPLPGDGGRRRHLLELRYHFASHRPRRGTLSLELPRLEHDVWVRRMYWQLVVPRDEHVIVSPAGFTCEFNWGWDGLFWGRMPLWDQAKLESWVGAEHRTELPEATNRYLFSTLGAVQGAHLQTASRSLIVLVASLAALVAGLLLIYVPASRHPASLFAVAVLLVSAGVLYPEPTLLVSQAASLGLALTLLAGLLARTMARRRRGLAMFEPPSAILDRDSTQTQLQPLVAGSQGSTQTAPALAPVSTTDSHS